MSGRIVLLCIIFFIAVSALPSPAAAGGTTWIQPGKTFLLGGEQASTIMIEGVNRGRVPVDILLSVDGRETPIATVAPGKSFSMELPAGRTAMFRNRGRATAALGFELTRSVARLSMRYDQP
jgi:hypothetical protein